MQKWVMLKGQLASNATIDRESISDRRCPNSFDCEKPPMECTGMLSWVSVQRLCKTRPSGVDGTKAMQGSDKTAHKQELCGFEWGRISWIGVMRDSSILSYHYKWNLVESR